MRDLFYTKPDSLPTPEIASEPVPHGWRRVSLGDLIHRITGGISLIAEDRPARAGEKGILKLSAISDGRLLPSENKVIQSHRTRVLGPHLRQGTLLISRSNTSELVGACAYVDTDYPDLHLPDLIWEVTLADENVSLAQWLNYALGSQSTRSALQACATGTSGSMKKLSMSALRRLQILLPPLQEQEKIVSALQTWDRAIDGIHRLVKAKNCLKKGLMQQLLTGKRRWAEFEGQLWREYHLGELFTEREEIGRTDLPLLSITADRGVVPRETVGRKDTSAVDKRNYKRIIPGDIGYNTMRMWQGVSAVSRIEGIVSPAYTVCIPSRAVDPEFMGYLFKLPTLIHLFCRYSQGLVDDTLSLKFHHFAEIKVTIPPIGEQRRIAEVLSGIDRELEQLRKLRHYMQEQKHGLLQKLLTGQIRVKV